MSTPKCTLGPRHKWEWITNTTRASVSATSIGVEYKGLYRCKCGATKYAEPNPNDPSNELGKVLDGLFGSAS